VLLHCTETAGTRLTDWRTRAWAGGMGDGDGEGQGVSFGRQRQAALIMGIRMIWRGMLCSFIHVVEAVALSLAIVSSLDPQLPSTQLLATPRNSPQLPFPFSGMTIPTGLHTDTCMYLSVSTDVLLCPLPSATNAAPGPVTCPSLLLVVPPVRLTPFQNPRTLEPPPDKFPALLAKCTAPSSAVQWSRQGSSRSCLPCSASHVPLSAPAPALPCLGRIEHDARQYNHAACNSQQPSPNLDLLVITGSSSHVANWLITHSHAPGHRPPLDGSGSHTTS
jgi:hypothetical protein